MSKLPIRGSLSVLRRLGMPWAESLPAIAFAVPPNSGLRLTEVYSYRLMRNFAASDYRADFAAATKPVTVFSGSADELIDATKLGETVGDRATVKIIDGVDHMAIVYDPAAISVIADDVATTGVSS